MKKILVFASLLFSLATHAQGKREAALLAAVRGVHQAVFVAKDSVALNKLYAREITYGHSGGKLEDRATAIHSAGANPSSYTGIQMGPVSVLINRKTAVTRYLLTGTETNKDGKVTELKLNILQAWTRQGKNWKMMARQAVKVS
ncbi:MAG: nuclear transport factor 2 family protein [Flaviaesturariibacter sp.]|nr:nuclear transport factor 2 family protein [Flaviaesturariibacter sp.]